MNTPFISVLMPVFNAEETIERAVGSILDQTLTELEIVVVDDGSTDGTRANLVELSRQDQRLVPVWCPHRGLVEALNEGLGQCKGRWIARMDADDWSAPARLERQAAYLDEHPEVDLVSCLVRIERPGGLPVQAGMARYQQWLNSLVDPESIRLGRFIESPVVHPSVLARRAVYKGGYRAGLFPEDYDLWLRRLGEGATFAKVPELLFTWTDGPTRLTRVDPSYGETAFFALKLEALLTGPLAGCRRVAVWGAGPIGKTWMRALKATGIEVTFAVELAPTKIGQRIHGAQVIHPDELTAVRDDETLLLAVGVEGARELMVEWLEDHGFRAGADYWAVC